MRLYFIFLLLFPIILFGQEQNEKLAKYSDTMRVEKLYIAHDKPCYIPGDIIWTKIWMIDGITHKRLDSDELVYIEWVDPKG